jgi:hypothetical protein
MARARSLFLFEGKLAATVMKCDYTKSQYSLGPVSCSARRAYVASTCTTYHETILGCSSTSGTFRSVQFCSVRDET